MLVIPAERGWLVGLVCSSMLCASLCTSEPAGVALNEVRSPEIEAAFKPCMQGIPKLQVKEELPLNWHHFSAPGGAVPPTVLVI